METFETLAAKNRNLSLLVDSLNAENMVLKEQKTVLIGEIKMKDMAGSLIRDLYDDLLKQLINKIGQGYN